MRHLKNFKLFEEAPTFDMEYPMAKGKMKFSQEEKDTLKGLGADEIDDYKITFNETIDRVPNEYTGKLDTIRPINYHIHVTKRAIGGGFRVEFECYDKGRQKWLPMFVFYGTKWEPSSSDTYFRFVQTLEEVIATISLGKEKFMDYCIEDRLFDIVNLSGIFNPAYRKLPAHRKPDSFGKAPIPRHTADDYLNKIGNLFRRKGKK